MNKHETCITLLELENFFAQDTIEELNETINILRAENVALHQICIEQMETINNIRKIHNN